MNLHYCHYVAGGVLTQAVAAVQFQKREVGSCTCKGLIVSMQHSSGRSPDEKCMRWEVKMHGR